MCVSAGGIQSVALGGQRLYDRATVLGLGASLAAVRRGEFELRAPSDGLTERELGVAFVPWLLAAIAGSDDVVGDADEGSDRHESHSLRLEPLALERQPLTPTLRASLTLGGYALRQRLPSHALATTLGINAAWTRSRVGELMHLGVLERESPVTHSAALGVTSVFSPRQRRA